MKIDLRKGDCLEVMKTIEENSVDFVCTDLPYGTTNARWDNIIDLDLMWEQLSRIVKPKGVVALFGAQPFTTTLINSNHKWYKYNWIWDKIIPFGFMYAKYQPMRQHEDIVVFVNPAKGGGVKYNPQMEKRKKVYVLPALDDDKRFSSDLIGDTKLGGAKRPQKTYTHRYPTSILKFKKESKNVHPTQKPVALLEYLIKTYTAEGEIVLDITMGSGSAGVACVQTKRGFIGIEMDEKYFDIAKERINGVEIVEKNVDELLGF